MEITFERGDSQRPKGHALAYFRVSTQPDKVFAAYIIILPVKADFAKYIPPFLAAHVGNLSLSDFSAFALPPVPEEVESYQELQQLSEWRDDDLVYGGSMFSFDLPRIMEAIAEVVQGYSQLYNNGLQNAITPQSPASAEVTEDRSFEVNEVLFSLMNENDKLTELSRLLGKLRFAVEGHDTGMVDEVTEEINILARHLPEHFQLSNLLAAARDASNRGSKLAQLYLDRCFRLSAGDLSSVQALDNQIQTLKAQ